MQRFYRIPWHNLVLLIAVISVSACAPKGDSPPEQQEPRAIRIDGDETAEELTFTIGPAFIYEHEARNYPYSRWVYLGERDDWHYFASRTYVMYEIRYRISNSYLPDINGHDYYDDARTKQVSADVEIHQNFIKIEIDDLAPVQIPFESKGFTTAAKRNELYPPKVDTNAPFKRAVRSLERLSKTYAGVEPQLKLPWATIYSKNAKGGRYTGNPLVIIHGNFLKGRYTGKYATATDGSITLWGLRYGHETGGVVSVGVGNNTSFTVRSNEKTEVNGPVKVHHK